MFSNKYWNIYNFFVNIKIKNKHFLFRWCKLYKFIINSSKNKIQNNSFKEILNTQYIYVRKHDYHVSINIVIISLSFIQSINPSFSYKTKVLQLFWRQLLGRFRNQLIRSVKTTSLSRTTQRRECSRQNRARACAPHLPSPLSYIRAGPAEETAVRSRCSRASVWCCRVCANRVFVIIINRNGLTLTRSARESTKHPFRCSRFDPKRRPSLPLSEFMRIRAGMPMRILCAHNGRFCVCKRLRV